MPQPTPDSDGPAGARPSPDLGLDRSGGRRAGLAQRVVARIVWPVLREQVAFNHTLRDDVRALGAALDEERVESLARDAGPALAALGAESGALAARVDDVAGRVEHQGWAIEAAVPKLEAHGYALASVEEALDGLRAELDLVDRQSFSRYHDGIGSIRSEIGDLSARVEVAADDVAERLAAERAAGEALTARLRATERAVERELAALRIRLAQVDLALGAAHVARRDAGPLPARLAGSPGTVEQLWAAYADALVEPASRAEARAACYLADIVGTQSTKPVVDVGAGRGEWLEVLRKAGLDARGVDVGPVADDAVAAGVVAVDDVVEHVRGLDRSSVGAVTAARVVGYLTAGEIVELVDLAALAIEPGGVLVIDLSDPVGAAAGTEPAVAVTVSDRHVGCGFLAFAVAARGFVDVELRRLAPRFGDAALVAGACALVARRP